VAHALPVVAILRRPDGESELAIGLVDVTSSASEAKACISVAFTV